MAVTLGSYTFEDRHTSITEKLEEVGGRNERRVTIKGMVIGKESTQDIHDELDLILAAASTEDYSAPLVVREGRRLLVRRDGFVRDVHGESLTGAFTLDLAALYPYEESIAMNLEPWYIFATDDTITLAPGGNHETATILALTPLLDMVDPSFGDGVNKFTYQGTVPGGSTLVLDGTAKTCRLDGEDVLAYTVGTFPKLDPAGTTLIFGCDPTEGEIATCEVEYRSRWF